VAYESKKLQDNEWRYPIHEKEMMIGVHFLQAWRHYLLGKIFIVKIDNVVKSYFSTQPNLSPKQEQCQDFLVEFNMTIDYQPSKLNALADSISRKVYLETLDDDAILVIMGSNT